MYTVSNLLIRKLCFSFILIHKKFDSLILIGSHKPGGDRGIFIHRFTSGGVPTLLVWRAHVLKQIENKFLWGNVGMEHQPCFQTAPDGEVATDTQFTGLQQEVPSYSIIMLYHLPCRIKPATKKLMLKIELCLWNYTVYSLF